MLDTDLIPRTEGVFGSLAAEDFGSVKAQMSFICARILTKRKVMGVWHDVITRSGQWISSADTRTGYSAGNRAVGQTLLNYEAGQWLGKVAYNKAGRITGLLIMPPTETANVPF